MIARTAAARAAASALLAGALIAGLTGCTFISTQATLIQYDPSDGVGIQVGSVKVRNAVALINDDGSAVSLMITLVNSGSTIANVAMQYESGGGRLTTTKSVLPGKVATYGTTPGGAQIVISEPGVKAGALYPVYIQYGDNEGKQLLVPVLDAAHNPQYDGLFPAEATK